MFNDLGGKTLSKLVFLQDLVDELKEANSAPAKTRILKKYNDLAYLLSLIYNKKFLISVDKLDDAKPLEGQAYDDFEELLEDLVSRNLTGQAALDTVARFIVKNYAYKSLILDALKNKLDCGISKRLVNNVFPEETDEF